MRSRLVVAGAIAVATLISGIAIAQQRVGDKTPTAEIEEWPRDVGNLGWGRNSPQDSRLDGGTDDFNPPDDRVALPNPCDLDPSRPGCELVEVPPPGGGGIIGPPIEGPPGGILYGCECPTMAVVPGGFIPALAQFTTFEECEEERLSLRQGRPGDALECSNYSSSPLPRACYSLHKSPPYGLIEVMCTTG